MALNVVRLVGRVGQDPEVKFFESGNSKCRLNLAVRRPTKDDETDWFTLEIWGKTAEVVANYVKKGSLIGVEGSLKFDSWADRNTGKPRSTPIINVEKIHLLGSKQNSQNNQNYTEAEFYM